MIDDDDIDAGIDLLPGKNPYDAAVEKGQIDYQNAVQRENIMLMAEKIAQAKLATQSGEIALNKEKLEYEKERGELLAKDEFLERQELIISCIGEVVRLLIVSAIKSMPQSKRKEEEERLESFWHAALETLAAHVESRSSRDEIDRALIKLSKSK